MDATPVSIPESEMMPRSPRYYSLDFWRGLACLLVIVYHGTYYLSLQNHNALWTPVLRATQLLWLGVPFFFVISGYCIAAAVDSSRRRGNTMSYFVRRFRRIYPPFWIFLALTGVLVFVTESWLRPHFFMDGNHPIHAPQSLNAWQWMGNLTLTETWRANVIGPVGRFFMGHAWTLCYEEQFYIVMGVLLLLFPRRLFVASVVVTALCFAARHILPRLDVPFQGFFFDGHWPIFAAGILVYYQINYASPRRAWLAAGVLLLGLGYSLREAPIWNNGYVTDTAGIFAFSFALLLLFLHRYDEKIASARIVQPFAFCGTMCYSLYLIHWPVVKIIGGSFNLMGANGAVFTFFVTVPLCIIVSVLCAYAFHVHVERRFLNLASHRDITRSSLLAQFVRPQGEWLVRDEVAPIPSDSTSSGSAPSGSTSSARPG